jgi:dihydroorotate dehydrogenase (fumarate)
MARRLVRIGPEAACGEEGRMDLTSTYLGLKLAHPLVPGASPLSDELDAVRRLEDAGAPAIVLRSLFAEQIAREEIGAFLHMESHGESFAEALSFFPSPEKFVMGPDEYLTHVARVKAAVRVPVIGSLNGARPGSWREYPRAIEQAGADALELNIYHLPTDPEVTGDEVEELALQAVREVKRAVRIPVAVKVSPFFSAFAHFAARLDAAGADGIVLFNRFYQPDIDPENLAVLPSLHLSTSTELPLRLRWLAILSGRVRASLAASGGVHDGRDAVKAVMAGAHAVQMVSSLLIRGPMYLSTVRDEMARWLEEHEYDSLAQARGSMNLSGCPDPAAYERANYMRILQSWPHGRSLPS